MPAMLVSDLDTEVLLALIWAGPFKTWSYATQPAQAPVGSVPHDQEEA